MSTIRAKNEFWRESFLRCAWIMAVFSEGHNEEAFGKLVDKKYLVDMLENNSKIKRIWTDKQLPDLTLGPALRTGGIAHVSPGPAEGGPG